MFLIFLKKSQPKVLIKVRLRLKSKFFVSKKWRLKSNVHEVNKAVLSKTHNYNKQKVVRFSLEAVSNKGASLGV